MNKFERFLTLWTFPILYIIGMCYYKLKEKIQNIWIFFTVKKNTKNEMDTIKDILETTKRNRVR